jgi:glycosyltransferase involved in cell wall biosynthesis
MNDTPPRISILLPTFNNADSIRPTLESVKWADEILIVDSFSTDATLEICREYRARIIQHEYVQSAKQKNWATPQCANEWVLQIDSDEILEEGTREEIFDALARAGSEVHAFRLARKNHILGEWLTIANLYPDYQTRLFRRERGRWQDKEVHAHVEVPGLVGTLHHHILHYGMKSISNQLRNLDRYSRYQADELQKRGKRFHWYHLALRPFAVFGYYYFWKRGFMAGYRGLTLSVLNTAFDWFAYAKLWELEAFKLDASPK